MIFLQLHGDLSLKNRFNIWAGIFVYNYFLFKGYYLIGLPLLVLEAARLHLAFQGLADSNNNVNLYAFNIAYFFAIGSIAPFFIKTYEGKGRKPDQNNIIKICVFLLVYTLILVIMYKLFMTIFFVRTH